MRIMYVSRTETVPSLGWTSGGTETVRSAWEYKRTKRGCVPALRDRLVVPQIGPLIVDDPELRWWCLRDEGLFTQLGVTVFNIGNELL